MTFPSKDHLSLAGLVLIYSFFWVPVLNVLPGIDTGDMGRDLYAFQMTLQNKWPCRDFYWQYGPLMLLYYASWFVIGGVNLISIRMGVGVLYLLSSLSVYRTLRLVASPAVSFLSALTFLNFDMTWTFNHIGAIPFLLLSIFFLWRFFLSPQIKWCYLALFSLAVVASIKINTGLTSFSAFYFSLLCFTGWFGWKFRRSLLSWKHLLLIPVVFGVSVLATYVFLYWGLPVDRVPQCLTVLPAYRVVISPWVNFKHLVLRFLVWERSRLIFVGIFLVLGTLAGLSLKRCGLTMKERETYPFVMISLFLFGIFNTVEYLMLGDLIYRFDFWIFPVAVLIMGFMAERASRLLGRSLKVLFGALVFVALLWFPFLNLREAYALKVPERYLDFPRGQVYLGGVLSDVKVIQEVTRFVIDNTAPTQEILVITYDILYCFLSDRRHPVREAMFLQWNNFQESQEKEIIQRIEAKQIPFILLSSRYRSPQPGAGRFGETYCRRLAQYIFDHYREIRTFGPWEGEHPFHAVKVLKRK